MVAVVGAYVILKETAGIVSFHTFISKVAATDVLFEDVSASGLDTVHVIVFVILDAPLSLVGILAAV